MSYCCSLLSRHLDLCDDKMQQLLDEGKEHASKNAASSLKRSWGFFRRNSHTSNGCTDNKQLFGAPLPVPNGPTRILQLIEFLKKYVHVDGLFRVSGNKRRTDGLKTFVSEPPVEQLLDVSAVEMEYNPHDVASVVKHYFAELPDSILQSKHFIAYEQIADLQDSTKTEVIQLLLLLLPPVNRSTLFSLFQLLSLITMHQHQNRMDSHNLAVVMTPNLCGHSKSCSSCQSAITINKLTPAVQHMISHCDEIFQVPHEILMQLRIQAARKANGQDDETPVMTSTSCKQMSMDEYEQTTQQTTQTALAELYQKIQDMPDGKIKHHFVKRIEMGMPGTPPFVPKHRQPLEECNRVVLHSYTPIEQSGSKLQSRNKAAKLSDIDQMDTSTPSLEFIV